VAIGGDVQEFVIAQSRVLLLEISKHALF